jgi:PqqD family protein of HPr-rel-A system
MQWLVAPAGTLLQSLGNSWSAFSELSGETHLLNHEAAALLEALREQPQTLAEVADLLAAEAGVAASSILHLLDHGATELQAAGLLRRVTNR